MKHRLLASLVAATLSAGLLAGLPAAPSTARVEPDQPRDTSRATRIDGCLESVPEPGSHEPVEICYSLFKPPGASAARPVPMIMHSHGWGQSRTTKPAEFRAFTRAGYGVLSFDQRGWGESGGYAHVEDPRLEGADVRRLVDLVSRLAWVQQDGRRDPRLGAIGGSYGGGYQFVGAFELQRLRGKPVFDALAPQITWNDLSDSLAPTGVVRTEWALALSAAALPSNALPPKVYKALVEGAATGQWPDGSLPLGEDLEAFFERNGPQWHVGHGRRLDIPVLFGQGTTDTLFPLQQGLANWRTAITPRARKQSIFVGYNGGHTLPALFPAGVSLTSDPCSRKLAGGDFERLSLRFFDEQLRGRDRGLRGYGRLHLATVGRGCVSTTSPEATRTVRLGDVVSPTVAGLPQSYEIAEGPITIAGSPYLTARATTSGLESRAFYGLAVGSSPLDARLVQNNVLPLSVRSPVTGAARRIALPSTAVRVPAGQRLYLLVSPISDTFVAMSSRTPGLISLADTVVHLPVVR